MKLFDINKMSKVIGDVVNEGVKIAGDVTNTVVKVGGDVVNEGVKIAGDVTNTVVKVGGDVVNEGTKIAGDVTNTVVKVGGDVVNEGAKIAGDVTNTVVKVGGDVVNEGVKAVINVTDTTVKALNDVKQNIMAFIDVNGNGQIDIEDMIIMGLSIPNIKVNRKDFLQKVFIEHYSQDVVDEIVTYNSAHAKIPMNVIDKIANDVIQYEKNCVLGISIVFNQLFDIAGILASIIEYYGYMLRITQKLMYLYGFPEIDVTQKESKFDKNTLNTLIICLGTMFGIAGANYMIKKYADELGKVLEEKTPSINNIIYPILVNISKCLGITIVENQLSEFYKNNIIAASEVFSTTAFQQCCDRLKNCLQDTYLNKMNHNGVLLGVEVA